MTRYVAEGVATLDQMLLITFSRAATQELRDRVRRQIADAVAAFDHPDLAGDNEVLTHLLTGTAEQLEQRRERLADALAGFDAATIATIHQFCNLVLTSLGVAGDSDAGVKLVESLDELVTEIVDDLYLARFGRLTETAPAGLQARAQTRPRGGQQSVDRTAADRSRAWQSYAAACVEFARSGQGGDWRSANAAAASSATTTCSAGWPTPWRPRTPRRGRG